MIITAKEEKAYNTAKTCYMCKIYFTKEKHQEFQESNSHLHGQWLAR